MKVYELKAGSNRTVLMGDVRKVGERVRIADVRALSESEQELLREHFLCVGDDDDEKVAALPARLSNGLTEEQAREKLKASGVVYADNVPKEELPGLFERVFAVHRGATEGTEGTERVDRVDKAGAVRVTKQKCGGKRA